MEKKYNLVTFGEVMMRLSSPSASRVAESDIFNKCAGGSELNVAAGASILGAKTAFITSIPDNFNGSYVRGKIREKGVFDEYVLTDESDDARLGIYYYEFGASPKKPTVVYDRNASSFSKISLDDIPEEVFDTAEIFHTCGISLALNKNLNSVTKALIRKFKEHGALISFDCNFRANLWSVEEARAAVTEILPLIDIFFVSEETNYHMMGRTGELEDIMKSYSSDYGVSLVFTTQRKVKSPKTHDFTSIAYDAAADKFFTEKPYLDIDIVDRVGSGDAYCSGVLGGLIKHSDTLTALQYGNAAAAIKCTVPGDMISTDKRELESIIKEHNSDGPKREMNR